MHVGLVAADAAGSGTMHGSRALVLAVVGCHVGVAGADVLVAGGARRDAAAALAAGAARPQAHLGPPRLAAPVRAARAAVCMRSPQQQLLTQHQYYYIL
jgi:hypothetical protein